MHVFCGGIFAATVVVQFNQLIFGIEPDMKQI